MVQDTECPETCLIFDIISDGRTEVGGSIEEEIEFLKENYDGIVVEQREGFYPKISLTLEAETYPKCRVIVEVAIVGGYPFIAPRVRLKFLDGFTSGSIGSLDEFVVHHIQSEIRDAISPCLLEGLPCIMRIISVVEGVLLSGGGGARRPCTSPVDVEHPPASAAAAGVEQPPPSPHGAQTTTTLTTQEIVRISLLLLHLLHKCCYLKDLESVEEANGNFEFLSRYLIHDVKVLPKRLKKCIHWKYDYIQREFKETMRESMNGSDIITKWLWSQEEGSRSFENVLLGRYKNEFIQQRILGSGGFAPVFVCRKKIDGRLYAVKKILIKKNGSEKVLREVQSLAALSHKNIVRYYDAWMEPGCDEDLREYLAVAEEEEEEEDEEDEDGEERGTRHRTEVLSKEKVVHRHNFLGRGLRTGSSDDDDDDDDYDNDDDDSSSTSEDSSTSSNSSSNDSHVDVLTTPYISHSSEYHTLYILMELCSKLTLRRMIEESDKCENTYFSSAVGEKIAARIFRQLLTVVAHFHGEKIVHRDLKPDNILFEKEDSANGSEVGAIRVADFGLAREMHQPSTVRRNTSSFEVDHANTLADVENGMGATGNLGSVLYCAPEQERGDNYDFKVDEYSVGMIALEMWLTVAGKGFRERFNIMTEISRGNPLPGWFIKWNPIIAKIISCLVECDPRRRRSCEEVLNTSDLPGDPADIVEALETIERHGERITSRILHCIQKIMIPHYNKLSLQIRDSLRNLTSVIFLELVQAVHFIGYLHGSMHVAYNDFMVPMNSLLGDLNIPYILDMKSRIWATPSQPHLIVASFINHMPNSFVGSFYQFFCKERPYAVFTTPLSSHGNVVDETFLDPMLSFLHLLSITELTCKLDIVISHVDWMQASCRRESNSSILLNGLFNHIKQKKNILSSQESIQTIILQAEDVLIESGLLQKSSERVGLIKSFSLLLYDILPLFGKHMSSNINLYIDPTLQPSKTSVDECFLEQGLIVECRSGEKGGPVAFFCSLKNFTNKCITKGSDIPAMCLSVDLLELSAVSKRVSFPSKSLLLSGVAISRQDLYSPSHVSSVITNAIKVWNGNVRACLRVIIDNDTFCKAMKAKKLPIVLLDGTRFAALESFHHGKIIARKESTTEDVCVTIRRLNGAMLIDDVRPKEPVIFLRDETENEKKKKSLSVEEVREIFFKIATSLSHILAVDLETTAIQKDISEVMDPSLSSTPLGTKAETSKPSFLVNWLRNNMSKHGVLPVFSTCDKTISFFIDQKQFGRINHSDSGKRKK